MCSKTLTIDDINDFLLKRFEYRNILFDKASRFIINRDGHCSINYLDISDRLDVTYYGKPISWEELVNEN